MLLLLRLHDDITNDDNAEESHHVIHTHSTTQSHTRVTRGQRTIGCHLRIVKIKHGGCVIKQPKISNTTRYLMNHKSVYLLPPHPQKFTASAPEQFGFKMQTHGILITIKNTLMMACVKITRLGRYVNAFNFFKGHFTFRRAGARLLAPTGARLDPCLLY